ncbi:MAG: energy transducer TonB [Steroidobacteraceae bacterium]
MNATTMKVPGPPGGALLPAALAALLLSLVLFGLMHSVISTSHHALEKREALPAIDFVRLKRDSATETLSRSKPPPPPPAPPPPPKMKIASEAVASAALSGMAIPSLSLKADVGGEALGGKGPSVAALFDGDIVPLQCPPVSYPSDARRAGLSGWVQVEFVVNPDGSVRTARAIEAQPRGVFEAAAVMAAQRCKFKPKMADGKPVEQRGKRKWNFDLNKGAEG